MGDNIPHRSRVALPNSGGFDTPFVQILSATAARQFANSR